MMSNISKLKTKMNFRVFINLKRRGKTEAKVTSVFMETYEKTKTKPVLMVSDTFNKKEKNLKILGKTEARKNVSVVFQHSFKKAEEWKDEEEEKVSERLFGKWGAERPKSAGPAAGFGLSRTWLKRRPRSSEVYPTSYLSSAFCENPFEIGDFRFANARCECGSFLDVESPPEEQESWTNFKHLYPSRRRCKSESNFSKPIHDKYEKSKSELDLLKMRRSLRLLGFKLSDFGVLGRAETTPRGRMRPKCLSTFCTKVTNRSVSLDSLREAIRRAWLNDEFDESHRKLLSQAAYEEWYFRKEKELWDKREEEKNIRAQTRKSFIEDVQKKRQKSEEEFQKWLERKKAKRKEGTKDKEKLFSRLTKTKEETEVAFLQWKRAKDKELEKKGKKKKQEEEEKLESERQKLEKKAIAEKAFQQWKIKVEKNEQLKEETKKRNQMKQMEIEQRKKREEGSQISFQIWKARKDKQLKKKIQQIREMDKTARQERLAQMEERMYEAEQAFEDWLEKVESRKQKCFCLNNYKTTVPWIPV